jgi:hypothetical protein
METLDCRRHQNEIDRLFAGELPDEAHQPLLTHVEGCRDCAGHYALVEEIAAAPVPDPGDAELSAMRGAVLRTIRSERAAWWRSVPHAAAIAMVAGAALLAALGWIAGRSSVSGSAPRSLEAASPDIILARQIQRVARGNAMLEDVENSPFRYTNVRMEEAPDGRVRLAFDVSRHLELTLPQSDPLVTEVLVQSVLEAGSVGAQLEAIGRAGNILDPRIRGALVKAMLHDPNLGVRLQAQSRLVEQPGDGEIEAALVSVLENEESVQMRLVAIDYLTRGQIDPNRLRAAVEAGEPEGRGAVRVKAEHYILSPRV